MPSRTQPESKRIEHEEKTGKREIFVNSVGALGSTGNYAYLDRNDRFRLAQVAVERAGGIPVMVVAGSVIIKASVCIRNFRFHQLCEQRQ